MGLEAGIEQEDTHLGLDVKIQMTAEGGRSKGLVAERAVAVLGSLGRRVQTVVEVVLAAIGRVVVRCRVLRPVARPRHSVVRRWSRLRRVCHVDGRARR
jgi:hypothetical protein